MLSHFRGNEMLRFVKSNNVYLLPVIGLVCFYIASPPILGVLFGSRDFVFQLLILSALSLMAYYFAYLLFPGDWFPDIYRGAFKVRMR